MHRRVLTGVAGAAVFRGLGASSGAEHTALTAPGVRRVLDSTTCAR